jgi:hypothetical protein
MVSQSRPTLTDLSVDLLFTIFKKLDRPSKLALGLSSPAMLRLLARYFDLDRYRTNPLFREKLSVPESVSWEDSKAQGPIIRWIAMPGNDDIDDPGEDVVEGEESYPGPSRGHANRLDASDDDDRNKPYGETEVGKEEVMVQNILEEWLRRKCGAEGGVIICAECYKFMRLRPDNGRREPWCKKMMIRDL